MKHRATRELFAYWNELRGERAAPERNDVDPTAIRDILADTFMLEVDLDGRFEFRLAGTRVNALLDGEQKGRSFLDIWRAEERRNLAAILMTVADSVCPVVAGAAGGAEGRAPCALEVLLLPLRHHGRTHSRILGLMKGTMKPSWVGVLPLQPLSLRALRIVGEEESAALLPVGVDAERRRRGRTSVSTQGETPTTGPALRVIQGGLTRV